MVSTEKVIEVPRSFDTTGRRLAHILDKAGFKRGRGRIQQFQTLIRDRRPDLFTDVSFNTIRSWFRDHAPHMNKIEAIIHTLHDEYHFEHDLALIASWWKLGGFYPFTDSTSFTDRTSARSNSHGAVPRPVEAGSAASAPVLENPISENPLFISQIILFIEEMRQGLGVELSTSQFALISGRIIAFCTKNQLSIESEHLKEQISRMLHLARDGLI